MESHITATQAARSFSDILNRVRYRGETFLVERGGEPVCRISPAEAPKRSTLGDLVRLLRALPVPDVGYMDSVEQISRKQPRVPGSPWGR